MRKCPQSLLYRRSVFCWFQYTFGLMGYGKDFGVKSRTHLIEGHCKTHKCAELLVRCCRRDYIEESTIRLHLSCSSTSSVGSGKGLSSNILIQYLPGSGRNLASRQNVQRTLRKSPYEEIPIRNKSQSASTSSTGCHSSSAIQ